VQYKQNITVLIITVLISITLLTCFVLEIFNRLFDIIDLLIYKNYISESIMQFDVIGRIICISNNAIIKNSVKFVA
jgi:hypothetical protein